MGTLLNSLTFSFTFLENRQLRQNSNNNVCISFVASLVMILSTRLESQNFLILISLEPFVLNLDVMEVLVRNNYKLYNIRFLRYSKHLFSYKFKTCIQFIIQNIYSIKYSILFFSIALQ